MTTFIFVCLCFVIFRAESFADAITIITHLFVPQTGQRALHIAPLVLVVVFAAGTVLGRNMSLPALYSKVPWPLRAAGYALTVVALMALSPTTEVPFVYFQF